MVLFYPEIEVVITLELGIYKGKFDLFRLSKMMPNNGVK